ncbi:MAG: hypothetical protein C4551_02720 [Bacillota bacterium]|nr:MAG: hypothetical protein C4551_02720 [Bacillota bacterium]
MREFITSRDIELRWALGEREVVLSPGDVVTGEAEELAERLGMRIVRLSETGEAFAAEGQPSGVAPALRPHDDAQRQGPVPAQASVHTRPRLDLAITGGVVVLPGEGTFETDVWIKNGRVVCLGSGAPRDSGRVLDAAGRYVLPGVVDPHVHLGLFAGLEEDLETETRSALLGGVTTIGCYLGGPGPHQSLLERLDKIVEEHSSVDVFPHLIIGTETQLDEMTLYAELGVTSFKFYMCGIPGLIQEVDDGFLMEGLRRCASARKRCVACVHAENASIVARASRPAGGPPADSAGSVPGGGGTQSNSYQVGSQGQLRNWAETHPSQAEEDAIRRLAWMTRVTGATVYAVHVSSASGLQAVREARASGLSLVAEVASPHLVLSWDSDRGSVAKMVPPFRSEEDRQALWRGVEDGTVSALGTDNVTMTREQKGLGGSFGDVMPGYPAMATHLAAVLTEGAIGRGLSIVRAAELLARGPSEVFGLYPRKGTLLPGSDADAVLVDVQRRTTIRHDELGSRAGFSLFDGCRLVGWPFTTVQAGRVVVEEGRSVDRSRGRLILR